MSPPVYALVGNDSFLHSQRLAAILQTLPQDVQRVDLDGERAELAEVLDELRSFAMFGSGKVVVLRNGDAFLTRYREQLEDYVASPSDSATLVLRLTSLPSNQRIYKAIAKAGKIEDCNPPKARDLPQWVMKRAAFHRTKIDADAAAILCDLVGDDLGRLDSELAKLALSCESAQIDAELISGCICFQRERQMWDMTNELAAGHTAEALRRWRQLTQLDPSTEFRAVTWLGMWLENVRKAQGMLKSGMNSFAICSALRIWPREAQEPFLRTSRALGPAGSARALDLLARTDLNSKSGVGDAATNVETFILELGQLTGSSNTPSLR